MVIMARILILIIIGFILVKILKHMLANADSKSSAKENMPAAAAEKMIQCAKCGCHVPISESRRENNQLTCNNPECQP